MQWLTIHFLCDQRGSEVGTEHSQAKNDDRHEDKNSYCDCAHHIEVSRKLVGGFSVRGNRFDGHAAHNYEDDEGYRDGASDTKIGARDTVLKKTNHYAY